MSNLFSVARRPDAVAATHSGSFHADDVFAAAALRLVNPAMPILRTREPVQLEAAQILFDVGRILNPATGRFDHHQKDYKEARENGIPYSSFGLIWRELGSALCGSLAAAERVDRWLVQGVDALDCGVTLNAETPMVTIMSITSAISGFNPGWQDDTSPSAMDQAFERAMMVAQVILQNTIREANGQEQARTVVRNSVLSQAGRLLLLETDAPWKETVLESPEYAQLLYVIYPVASKWHLHTVPDYPGSFNNRKSLPAAWAGLDGEALDAASGVKGCVFCHKGRFVAGHQTREGALELAQLALRNEQEA